MRVVLLEDRSDVFVEALVHATTGAEDHYTRPPVRLGAIGSDVAAGWEALHERDDALQKRQAGDDVEEDQEDRPFRAGEAIPKSDVETTPPPDQKQPKRLADASTP